MAQAYSTDGDPDRAIEEYKLTLMFDPNSALIYARLATEYVKKGMLSAAMETCKEAIERDPNYTDARLLLAGSVFDSSSMTAALAEYDRILKNESQERRSSMFMKRADIDRRAARRIRPLECCSNSV